MGTYLLFIVFRKCNLGWGRGTRVDSQKQNESSKKEKRNVCSQSEVGKISLPTFLPAFFPNGISAAQSYLRVVMPAGQMKYVSQSLISVQVFVTPWVVARQAPLSLESSRQEYQSGLPFPSPGHLPNPGIEPGFPTLWTDSLPSESPGKPKIEVQFIYLFIFQFTYNIVLVSGV